MVFHVGKLIDGRLFCLDANIIYYFKSRWRREFFAFFRFMLCDFYFILIISVFPYIHEVLMINI
jgi:hypothetical protein